MVDKPPVVQQPSNAGMNPNQFAQPGGFGQQQPNMGYGGFGQQPMNTGFGQQQMNMGFGQQQMNPGFGQQQMNMGYGGFDQQGMNMGFGQQQMNMGLGTQLMATPPPMAEPPPPVPGVPIGLEALLPLSHVFVKQQPEMLEVMLRVETPNRYDVIGGNGQRIYLAAETTPPNRMYFGANRPFTVDIIDFYGRRVMSLSRVDGGCCSAAEMFVSLGDGTKLGEVLQTCCCKPEFRVTDSTGKTIMMIKGPSDACCVQYSAEFNISMATKEATALGVVRKTFTGQIQEYLTDADTFGVEFPAELDIRWKGLIFAAVFLIDFAFFERTQHRHSHHRHGGRSSF